MPGETVCRAEPPPWGERSELACELPPRRGGERFRIEARFEGSHDDTRLRLGASAAGVPIACDGGSKTESSGEDGDAGRVVLAGRFVATGRLGTRQAIVVETHWHHAQYVGLLVVREPPGP